MARRPSSKYIIAEASEDESESVSEELDEMPVVAEAQRDWTRFTQDLEQKYADVLEEEEEETVELGIKQASLVPKNTSPRLFIVRVKRGSERDITMRIVQNDPKHVFSIVCKDGLSGYLYIEAYQKQHVVDALDSLKGVSRTRVSVVPQKEMIEALTYHEEEVHGEWGRVRKGKYKNDLVRIVGAEGEMVKVRVVPRIDGERKLFRPEDYRDEDVSRLKGYCVYRRDTYVDGFLEKDVLRSSIDVDIEPTFAELEEFRQACPVAVGDRVVVTRGELIGMKGVVKSVSRLMAVIHGEEGGFEVLSSSLARHFDVGEAVSVGGENGVVVKAENGRCVVAIRDFTEELRVHVDEVKAPVSVQQAVERTASRQQGARRDALINKEVRIQAGSHKGYTGVVKEVYNNVCRVQLNSNMRFVNVERGYLAVLDGFVPEQDGGRASGFKTPVYKTPGYKTPGYKTPGYKTPSHKMYEAEETGAEWLVEEDLPFKGTLIRVGDDELVLEDCRNNVFMTRDRRFAADEVSFVVPQKNDLVCVLSGEKKGTSGILIAINGDFGIVRSSSGPVVHLPIDQMSKKVY